MEKKLLIIGSSLIVIAVILGALAAHALKNHLTADQMSSFETGVRYQMYHGLALLIFSQIDLLSDSSKNVALILFILGTVLFSLSIYLLTTSTITGWNLKFLGPVTPVGGLLLISGWVYGIIKFCRF